MLKFKIKHIVMWLLSLLVQHSTSTRKDVVATVKDWGGVKVVSLERVLRAVEKHRSLISSGTAAGSHSRLVVCSKPLCGIYFPSRAGQ